MLDLFTSGKTFEEQIKDLKSEIKSLSKKQGNKKGSTKLFYGDSSVKGDCILLIVDPPTHKYFETFIDKEPVRLLKLFKIDKYLITYNYLLYKSCPSVKDVKDFSPFIQRLTDIIEPKIIVCMGELSQFCYFKQKFLLKDYSGKCIGDYYQTPIYTTHSIDYYSNFKAMEDQTYKEHIKKEDWKDIVLKYKGIIK